VAGELDRVRQLLLERAARTRLPSVVLAAVRGGEASFVSVGFRDVSRALPADPDTLYGVGSVTKSFTCLALLKLEEQGLLSLDDPVGKHLPLGLEVGGEPVRLHHLMTHTSGIPALAYAEALIRGLEGEPDSWLPAASPDDVIALLSGAAEWAEARPGERFFYLNEGYVLLGRVIERVAGVPYREYVEREVLRPLGMVRSTFKRETVESDPNVARPYLIAGGELREGVFPWGVEADGGLWSCARDLAAYLRFLLTGQPPIVSRERVLEALRPRAEVPWKVFGDESYGYGWVVTERFPGGRLVSHGGSVLVYTAWVGFLPEKGLGVALLANGSGYPLSHLGMAALALLCGLDPMEVPSVRVHELLDRLCGEYVGYRGLLRARVKRLGSALVLEMGGRYSGVAVPLFYEGSREGRHVFYTGAGSMRTYAEFREEGGRIVLLYERYKLVRAA